MIIIHFTHGATDPLQQLRITAPSITHAATLLVVHGGITILDRAETTTHINVHAGLGFVVDAGEAYSFNSERGAILLIIEATELKPTPTASPLPNASPAPPGRAIPSSPNTRERHRTRIPAIRLVHTLNPIVSGRLETAKHSGKAFSGKE
jgi:hypothetical protein